MNTELAGAYEELEHAIEKVRALMDPGLKTFLGDWALIAVEHDIQQPGKATYSRLFRGGGLPYHVCIGLYETALELTQEAGAEDED